VPCAIMHVPFQKSLQKIDGKAQKRKFVIWGRGPK
jgi:hypothetical protein